MSHRPWNCQQPWEPDGEDAEGPGAEDLEGSRDDDEYDLVPCPRCRREISELAQQCPHCGDWIVPDAGAGAKRGPWIIAIAILLLLLLLLWVF